MNGYVNFREDYTSLIVEVYMTGDPDPNYIRHGSYKYVEEIFKLNKLVYMGNAAVRGPALLIGDPGNGYFLNFTAFNCMFNVTFTPDDIIHIDYKIITGG